MLIQLLTGRSMTSIRVCDVAYVAYFQIVLYKRYVHVNIVLIFYDFHIGLNIYQPGLQFKSDIQSSISLANFLYNDALPAFAERCVYIHGNPAQSRLLGVSIGCSMLPLKRKK